jgi:virginiamycin B lyase
VHTGRAGADEPITAGGFVARIDPATNKVVSSTKVWPRPYYMTAGFGGIWTGTATRGSVARVDVATEEVTHIQIGEDGAFDIDVSGDSVWAVVGPQWPVERQCDPEASFFVRIDPGTRQMTERIAFPCPGSITPTDDGFWVSGSDGKAAVSTFFEAID